MPNEYRRCFYLDERGQQCDTWFPADENKLCPLHRGILNVNGKINPAETPKYIDLVNDERSYCYHFLDGTAQEQSQNLIHEFKDDKDGTIFEKLDAHIAFIEKIIEDMKARLHEARVVRAEKIDNLSEEERKHLRSIKIDKVFKTEKQKTPSFKADPISFLSKKQGMSKEDAKDLLSMDTDALLAKFEAAKKNKEK